MKPSGFIDAEFTEWLTQFVQAASALPIDSTPSAIRCRSCGAILDGVVAGLTGISTQQSRPMYRDDDGLISFWSESVGEPVLHQRKPFHWQCRDCKNVVKLVPPQKVN